MPNLTPNYKFKKPIPNEDVADITVINENFDTADNELKKSNDSIKNLENNKQNKEDSTLKTLVKTIVGGINELYDELIKKATKTQLGRIKVGNNLTVDEDGTLHGNPSYTHPTGNGNNHIPVNGASGNFLKWLSSGAAQWANITWSDITGKPSTFTPSSHTHTKANITDFPTSIKNPYALSIQLNNGTANTYDGAVAKSINITPSSIGAAPSSHTHDDRYFTESEINEKFKNFCPFPVNSLYLSLGSENPSTLWLGTTWQKQEGRFLLGSSGSYALGITEGASTVKLAIANLPSHTHSASQSAHTHSQPTHTHKTNIESRDKDGSYVSNRYYFHMYTNTLFGSAANSPNVASAGGDTTGSATPSISIGATGSGTAFSIMPPYLVINIWKRLS